MRRLDRRLIAWILLAVAVVTAVTVSAVLIIEPEADASYRLEWADGHPRSDGYIGIRTVKPDSSYLRVLFPPPRPEPSPAPPETRHTGAGTQGAPCGGDLPPCWVLDRESGHNDGIVNTYELHARNPGGCSGRGCFGKWQCDPSTCDGTGSEAEQDAEARRVWANGAGCSHWNAC